MCVVSAIHQNWQDRLPQIYPWVYEPQPEVTREEIDALRREVEELKELLKVAKKFDDVTGQPDCETEDKTEIIRQVEKLLDKLK